MAETKSTTSFAGLLDELLNTPPTRSVIRVYLLVFIIWNKFYLAYLFFGEGNFELRFELAKNYIPFYNFFYFDAGWTSWVSIGLPVYIIPLGLVVLFYLTIPRLYEIGYGLHVKLENKLLVASSERTEIERQQIRDQVRLQQARQGLEVTWRNELDSLHSKANKIPNPKGGNYNLQHFLTMASNIIYTNRGYFDIKNHEIQQVISFCDINNIIRYYNDDQSRIKWTEKGQYIASALNISSEL